MALLVFDASELRSGVEDDLLWLPYRFELELLGREAAPEVGECCEERVVVAAMAAACFFLNASAVAERLRGCESLLAEDVAERRAVSEVERRWLPEAREVVDP